MKNKKSGLPGSKTTSKDSLLAQARPVSPEDELETLRLYSNMEITSSEAKTVLGCDRMELIEKLGRAGLGLPRLPRDIVDKMADEVIKAMSLESYERDVVVWAQEQAQLLRSGQFADLDIEHIADEIEDVGKSEQRELSKRMASLVSQLIQWEFQPERHGKNVEAMIQARRNSIERRIRKTPSLKALLADQDWWKDVWDDAVVEAYQETGIDTAFPETCPWTADEVMNHGILRL